MKKYMCILCGYIYDEEQGWPQDGIEPGTRWEDVPQDWLCPECAARKSDFEMIELKRALSRKKKLSLYKISFKKLAKV